MYGGEQQQPDMQALNALKRQRVDGEPGYAGAAGGVAANGAAGYTGGEAAFPAVKLRGLPFDVSENDVRVFLVRPVSCLIGRTARSFLPHSQTQIWQAATPVACDPLPIFLDATQADEPVDILMVKRDGRFSGEAIVVLGSVAQVEQAVAKNRSYLGRRYVEVFKAKKLVS